MDRSRIRLPLVLTAAAVLVVGLTGCAGTVSMGAAPSANAVACAGAQVRLPGTVDGTLRQRTTNAQSTAAWGTPTAVLYRCGVAVPVVSNLPCFTLDQIDWIRDARGNDVIYTTYGRNPAVQVVIDSTRATPSVLQDIGTAVGTLPRNGLRCLAPSDAATPAG
ncbi:DUF3515 family protein [Curtobacterium ammoniigenes]|uniref:DUF3515 family protein n=1 Tax=Curtobacterium ammoniigenes TaxID=395387 RepID=UPI00083380D3|nr:DUF3515 family protein [Curtobacterium ammoniigenes]